MTIPTQQSTQTFLGNGVTTTFNFSFVGDSSSFITVQYTDSSGNVTTLSPSQYTIFLNAPDTGALWGIGGTVTYPTMGSPIENGTSLTITRTLPLTQTTTISNQGNFAPQVVETALDTLEMQIQQVSGRTGLFRGEWATDIFYNFGDYIIDGANGEDTGNYYMCLIANTSGTWSTDLAAGDWILVINVAAITADVAAAAASAAAAATSASSSATSATASANSATSSATSATASANSATSSATSATASANSATQASNYAASYSGTSTSSLSISIGAKVFTTQASKLWVNGQYLQVASNADATNYMHGTVTSYSGTTLTMNITDIGGSGTHSDWNISISGTQGATGSGAAFDTISSGTNITAAMIVGSGASLAPIGTGIITATSLESASTVVNLSSATAPSSGQVLTATNSTTAIWQTPALILLSTQTASNSATIDFTSTYVTSTYKAFLLEVISAAPQTDADDLRIRLSQSGTFASGSGDYQYTNIYSHSAGSPTTNANSSTTQIRIAANTGVGNAANESLSGLFIFHNPTAAIGYKKVTGQACYNIPSDSSLSIEMVSGQFQKNTTACDGIRFLFSSGNIVSGIFNLYGVL